MYNKNFIQALMDADADLIELDDYIDYWHENNTGCTLREFLGMTPYEYQQWGISDDCIFRDILACRMSGIDFSEYVRMDASKRKVARSFDEDAIDKLRNESND